MIDITADPACAPILDALATRIEHRKLTFYAAEAGAFQHLAAWHWMDAGERTRLLMAIFEEVEGYSHRLDTTYYRVASALPGADGPEAPAWWLW